MKNPLCFLAAQLLFYWDFRWQGDVAKEFTRSLTHRSILPKGDVVFLGCSEKIENLHTVLYAKHIDEALDGFRGHFFLL